jgi:hypothetical protein
MEVSWWVNADSSTPEENLSVPIEYEALCTPEHGQACRSRTPGCETVAGRYTGCAVMATEYMSQASQKLAFDTSL